MLSWFQIKTGKDNYSSSLYQLKVIIKKHKQQLVWEKIAKWYGIKIYYNVSFIFTTVR